MAQQKVAVHGKFKSFKDMGEALGVKVKVRKERAKKCAVCGEPMEKVAGNVWVCHTKMALRDEMLKGKPVQVFGPCEKVVIDNPFGG